MLLSLLHWLSFKPPFSLHSLWQLTCWFGQSFASFEKYFCFYYCNWILWVGPVLNWCVHIPHCKYQVRSPLSPWLSVVSAAALAHRNNFNLLHINWSSDRLVIIAKGFLKLLNLFMPVKQESIFFKDVSSHDLWLFTKVNQLYHPYLTALFNNPSASDKAKLWWLY